MKLKKLAALGLVMTFCLSACAGKDTAPATDAPEVKTEEPVVSEDNAAKDEGEVSDNAAKEETPEEPSKEETEGGEETVTEKRGGTPIMYAIDYEYDYDSDPETYFTYFYVKGNYPWIAADGYDELKAALREQNTKEWTRIHESLENSRESISEYTEEDMEYIKSMMPWYQEQEVVVVRSDDLVFSYWLDEGTWEGGAHPNSYRAGYNFDSATGKLLELSDVVTDYDGFYELVINKLKDTQDTDYFYDEWEDTVHNMFYGDYSLEWTVSDEGINLYFNSYSLMPYAGGPVRLFVGFDECEGKVDSAYSDKGSERFLHYLSQEDYDFENGGYHCSWDSDGDGKDDFSLSVNDVPHYNEEYDYVDYTDLQIVLTKDGVESYENAELMSYIGSWVIEDENGDYYLYVEELSDNDWHALNIYDLNGAAIKSLDYNESGAFYGLNCQTPGNLYVTTRLDTFGSRSGVAICDVGRSGQLILKDGEYKIIYIEPGEAVDNSSTDTNSWDYDYIEYNYRITAKMDIPNTIYYKDIDDRDSGVTQTLPEGTVLIPYLTDGKKYMIFKVKDGEGYYRVDYDDEGFHQVNGYNDSACFDNIMYAG